MAGVKNQPDLFIRKHPVLRDNIDIDIRHGLSQWPTLLVRTIKNERVLPYSAASYLASHPVQAVEDLLACDLIHSDSTLINWSNWLSWHKVRGWHKNFIFNFDRSYMSIEAARMGMGVILEQSGRRTRARGQLTPVFADGGHAGRRAPLRPPHAVNRRRGPALLRWVAGELKRKGSIFDPGWWTNRQSAPKDNQSID